MSASEVQVSYADRVARLEKQLLKVWGALSLHEKKKFYLLNKFALLRGHVAALKEQAGIESKGTVDL